MQTPFSNSSFVDNFFTKSYPQFHRLSHLAGFIVLKRKKLSPKEKAIREIPQIASI